MCDGFSFLYCHWRTADGHGAARNDYTVYMMVQALKALLASLHGWEENH